ncbi:MAG TPA: ECF-type sigma factor [Chthoniobacterales bacterium]|nr:ECF-type sigma factor [Chthoniobacterales bacterium]
METPDITSVPGSAAEGGETWEGLADEETLSQMLPEVYEQLRNLAEGYLSGERSNHTLQATALVHEAYLRLRDQRRVDWTNRAQFLGIAARMMRRVLRNYATARHAQKRGGNEPVRVTLDEAMDFYHRNDISVAAVDEALSELEKLDKRQGHIVELRFFGGLTVEEIAKLLGISPATVKREWATAKLWLQHQLSEDDSGRKT